MIQKYLKILVFAAVFSIGLVILMNSIKAGSQDASELILSQGGSMDTAQYLIFLEQSIVTHRYVGAITALIGGLGLVMNAVKTPPSHI